VPLWLIYPPFPVTEGNACKSSSEKLLTLFPSVTVSTVSPPGGIVVVLAVVEVWVVIEVDVLQDASNIAATNNKPKPNQVTFFIC
jgi:hypothetical protein